MMKLFAVVLLLVGLQAEAATIGEIKRLLQSLDHQKKEVTPVLPTSPEMYDRMMGFQRCNYIRDFFQEIWSLPPSVELIDTMENRPEYMDGLKRVLTAFRHVDFDAVALLATRNFTRPIFMDRLRCPATMLEWLTISFLKREQYSKVVDENFWMVKELIPILKTIPHIETSGYTPEFIARQMAIETYGHVFNDTLKWMMMKVMEDVTYLAHWFYPTIKSNLPYIRTLEPTAMTEYLDKLVHDNWMVYCPTEQEVFHRAKNALWEFTYGLGEIESHEVCEGVRYFVQMFVPETTMHGSDEVAYEEILRKLCEVVNKYIHKVVEYLPGFMTKIEMRDPTTLLKMVRPYFSTHERNILTKVLEKLGWTTPGSNTPRPVLTITDVLDNEVKDVEHWNSWLAKLTPDYFLNMDVDAFKEMITLWLEDKYARMERYSSYGPEEPIHK